MSLKNEMEKIIQAERKKHEAKDRQQMDYWQRHKK